MLPLEFILYLQIIIFLFITPGTPRIVIISYSMNYGVGKCVWSALGDVTANLIQATLVIFIIGSFFSENSLILNIFKWIGVLYILYLAYDIYKSRLKNLKDKEEVTKSNLSFFRDGFLVAGTSPKAWMFFPFIFPQFIDFNQNFIIQFMILIFTYIILDFLSLVGYAMLAQKLIIWLKTNPKVINKISTAVLIFIAFLISISNNY